MLALMGMFSASSLSEKESACFLNSERFLLNALMSKFSIHATGIRVFVESDAAALLGIDVSAAYHDGNTPLPPSLRKARFRRSLDACVMGQFPSR